MYTPASQERQPSENTEPKCKWRMDTTTGRKTKVKPLYLFSTRWFYETHTGLIRFCSPLSHQKTCPSSSQIPNRPSTDDASSSRLTSSSLTPDFCACHTPDTFIEKIRKGKPTGQPTAFCSHPSPKSPEQTTLFLRFSLNCFPFQNSVMLPVSRTLHALLSPIWLLMQCQSKLRPFTRENKDLDSNSRCSGTSSFGE